MLMDANTRIPASKAVTVTLEGSCAPVRQDRSQGWRDTRVGVEHGGGPGSNGSSLAKFDELSVRGEDAVGAGVVSANAIHKPA